jgi:two-component system sensor histidine kinase PilS (NtrC family)
MQPDSDNTPLAQKLFGSATLQQQFLWMLVLRVFLYSVLLGADFLFQDERFNVIAVPIGIFALLVIAVYGSVIGSSVIFIRGIYDTRKFGFIQILLEVGFAATLIYLSGGSQSAFISVFFFAIITGSLLLPLKGGLVGASSATLLFGAILLLEHLFILPGYLRPQMEITSGFLKVNQFAIHGLMFFLAATVSGYIGLRLKSTIAELTSSRHDFNRLAELHQKIFNSISTGIITVNNHNEITSANPAIESITGITLAEMIGKKYHTIFPACELTEDKPRSVCDFLRPDGIQIRIGYSCAALRPGRHPDFTDDQKEETMVVTLRDISEVERLERQMRQSEKLAAIGMMSASIAHDFKNPLSAISGSAQLLIQDFSNSDAASRQNHELTTIILRESDRLVRKIGDFLSFARPDSIDRKWFMLKSCLQDVLQVCAADPGWPISCRFCIDMEPNFRICADEKQIYTIISHLIYNGMAMAPAQDKEITIQARDRRLPSGQTESIITVCDNGPGVEAGHEYKIFEPFYTTRPDGTGLGLAIVKQKVEAHGGTITVSNEPQLGGACFRITLPYPET